MIEHENRENQRRCLLALVDAQSQAITRLRAELEQLKAELQRADRREGNLKNAVNGWQQDFAALQCALRAKVDSKALREALAKAATVFEEYACHHFLKNADEKAQANRAHAKMCRDALATDSEVKP